MNPDEVPSVAPAEVSAKVGEGWLLLDVRTDEEWAQARIADSLHIPMDELLARIDEIDAPVVCVCAVGARSAAVTQYLNRHGHEAVNLDGGIYGWAGAGFPVER